MRIFFIIALLSVCYTSVLAQNKVKIDSLLALLPQTSETERIDILNNLADLHNSHATAKQGLPYVEQALALAQKIKDTKRESDAYNHFGNLYYKAEPDDWRQAIKYYEKALRLRESLADKEPDNLEYWKLVMVSNSDIGYLYWLRGFFPEALVQYERSINLCNELLLKKPEDKGLLDMLGKRYNSVGAIFWAQGKYSQGLGFYLKSHDIWVKLGVPFRQTITLSNIGLIYKEWKKPDVAMYYFRKAFHLADSVKYLYGKGYAQNNIAQIFEDEKKYDSANYFYNESMESYIVSGEKGGIGMNFNGLGSVAEKQKDLKKSLDYFRKAYFSSKNALNKFWECISTQNLAKVFVKLNQLDSAIHYSELSLNMAVGSSYQDQVKTNYETLSEVYTLKKDYEKALQYYRLFSTTKDSLFSKEKYKLLAETMEKYRTDKKEEENQVLRKESERQKWQNYALIIGLSAVVMVAFFIWFNRQKIQSKNNQLNRLNRAISQQTEILQKAHQVIKQKNEDITNSINVASRIQTAMLPNTTEIRNFISEFFVFFKPRDVVSGDFYWFDTVETQGKPIVFLAVVDCTGHGVPGAFMALTGEALLRQVINIQGFRQVDLILNAMNQSLNQMFRQEEAFGQASMDMAMVMIDRNRNILEFAGAKRPLVCFQNQDIQIIKGDRMSIGTILADNSENFKFTKHTINIEKEISFYLFSDGLQDQFGGEQNKKLGMKNLSNWFGIMQTLPAEEQQEFTEQHFRTWRGDEKQIDDVLLIGAKI